MSAWAGRAAPTLPRRGRNRTAVFGRGGRAAPTLSRRGCNWTATRPLFSTGAGERRRCSGAVVTGPTPGTLSRFRPGRASGVVPATPGLQPDCNPTTVFDRAGERRRPCHAGVATGLPPDHCFRPGGRAAPSLPRRGCNRTATRPLFSAGRASGADLATPGLQPDRLPTTVFGRAGERRRPCHAGAATRPLFSAGRASGAVPATPDRNPTTVFGRAGERRRPCHAGAATGLQPDHCFRPGRASGADPATPGPQPDRNPTTVFGRGGRAASTLPRRGCNRTATRPLFSAGAGERRRCYGAVVTGPTPGTLSRFRPGGRAARATLPGERRRPCHAGAATGPQPDHCFRPGRASGAVPATPGLQPDCNPTTVFGRGGRAAPLLWRRCDWPDAWDPQPFSAGGASGAGDPAGRAAPTLPRRGRNPTAVFGRGGRAAPSLSRRGHNRTASTSRVIEGRLGGVPPAAVGRSAPPRRAESPRAGWVASCRLLRGDPRRQDEQSHRGPVGRRPAGCGGG
jgi:hypothetical protein